MKIDLKSLISSRRSAEEQARRLAQQINTDLSGTRQRIAEVGVLIEEAQVAPCDRGTIEKRANKLVDDVIANLRSRSSLLDHLAAPASRFGENACALAADALSPIELAALSGRSELIASLVREAEACSTGEALTEGAREKLVAKLTAELRGLCAAEELLLRAVEHTGATSPRRADADPEILGADDETLTRLADGER